MNLKLRASRHTYDGARVAQTGVRAVAAAAAAAAAAVVVVGGGGNAKERCVGRSFCTVRACVRALSWSSRQSNAKKKKRTYGCGEAVELLLEHRRVVVQQRLQPPEQVLGGLTLHG
jgi:hypothetical protein